MGRKDRKTAEIGHEQQVTTVKKKRNTTTGRQIPLRITEQEQNELSLLVEAVRGHLPPAKAEKINRSRILRALVYIRNEQHLKRIAQSVIENT